MKRMKQVLTAAVMISAGAVFAAPTKGQCPKKAAGDQTQKSEMPPGARGCGAMMLKDLNLNDDQKEAIKKLHEEHMARMKEARTTLTEARKQLMELQGKNGVTEDEIKAASAKLADATAKMAMSRLKMRKEVNALLNTEQQKKLSKHMEEMKERMKQRMQEMHKRMEANRAKACGQGKGNAKKACGKGNQGVKKACSK